MNLALSRSLSRLIDKDRYLLQNDTSERSITHMLGMYLQGEFSDWNVDCEYNKNGSGPKYITIEPRLFLNRMAKAIDKEITNDSIRNISYALKQEYISIEILQNLKSQLEDSDRIEYDEDLDVIYFLLTLRNGDRLRKLIVPDVIVHRRGTDQNKLVIEAKKSSNFDSLSWAFDIIKLVTLVSSKEYHYEEGYFIDLPVGSDYLIHSAFHTRKSVFHNKVNIVTSNRL